MNDKSDPLQSLYPFLHDKPKDSASENRALLDSVQQKSQHSIDVKQQFFAHNAQALVDAAKALASCYQNGGKLLSMGNGGSSCDASHVAVEFQHPVTAGRSSLSAFNLNDENAFFSAMEFCGGHTHTIFRYGIEQMLPDSIEMVHGPSCPVCILLMGRVDDCVALAERPDVIFTTLAMPSAHPARKKACCKPRPMALM